MSCPAIARPEVARPDEVPARSGVRWRYLLAGVVLLALGSVGSWGAHTFGGSNFSTVVPGSCFRSAQPSPEQLRRWTRDHGLRSVVNLRGSDPHDDWYDAENEVALACGLDLRSPGFGARGPLRKELKQLIRDLDEAELPLLIHCYQGSDRTGFACACFLLLRTEATVAEARGQLSLWYGHWCFFGRAKALLPTFDQYEQWLAEQGQVHAPDTFRHWALEHYRSPWFWDVPRKGETSEKRSAAR